MMIAKLSMLGLPFAESIRCKLFEGFPVAAASRSKPTVTFTRSRSVSLATSGSPLRKRVRASSRSAFANAGSRFTRSTTVFRESLVSGIYSPFPFCFGGRALSSAIFDPKRVRAFNVGLLTPFRTTAEQNYDFRSILCKVNSIARSPIDTILANRANPSDGRRVSHLEASPRDRDLRCRLRRKVG